MIKLLVLAVLLISAVTLAFRFPSVQGQTAESKPNIIVIETDDQRWDTMSSMPTVMSRIAGEGINFTNAFVTTSMCCPSRSSFLTGLYTHNHGVWYNVPPDGGAPKFKDSSTLATWLKDSGYTTSLIGKYLNSYNLISPYIPPGWSDWHAFVKSDPTRAGTYYYNYTLNDNGVINSYGESEATYSTDVLKTKALDFISTAKRPFFLFFTPFAPHSYPVVAKRHAGTCDNLTFTKPPSFNEANVSDKPAWVKARPLFNATQSAQLDIEKRLQICSLKAVDEAVAEIISALGSELDNTMIVFTSDNGLMWGEHRLREKDNIYEESIRVPMAIRYPKLIKPGLSSSKFALNIDLPVTIAEVAGVTIPSPINGKSLTPLFANPSISSWRGSFLIEHGRGWMGAPTSSGVRAVRYKYVELGSGEREFYNLALDPYELINQINNPAYTSIISQLANHLKELKAL